MTTRAVTKKKSLHKDYRKFMFFSGIALLGFSLFFLYPVFRTVMLSFTDRTLFSVGSNYVGIENYLYALRADTLFRRSIYLSLVFAAVSGFFVLVTSLILALLMNQKVRFIGGFRTIYFLPFIIPSFAVGAVYKNLFDPNAGLINQVLSWFGVSDPPLWHVSPDSALMTMIIISAFGFGVKMLVFLAALQGIPKSLYEIAEIEGASKVRQFFTITLPLISPMLFFNVIMITIDGLKAFNLAFVMGYGEGWPANSTLVFPIYLFMTAFNMPFRLGYAAAMAWIFFLIILALTGMHFLLSKYYVQKDVV